MARKLRVLVLMHEDLVPPPDAPEQPGMEHARWKAEWADISAGDVPFWVTDMGWIMGPWLMVSAHAAGAAMVILEGSPDYPEPNRVWGMVERHGVTMLGVSPTLIRALKQKGDEHPAAHDLSALRAFASTGEPWNPNPYVWLSELTDGRVPIINISGGTEVGACFLSPYPVEPLKVCSLGGASLGMDVDVFDPAGNPLRGEDPGDLSAAENPDSLEGIRAAIGA